MARFNFSRVPRRDDQNAALVVQKNLEDLMNSKLKPVLYYPSAKPRLNDPLNHMVVNQNMIEAVPLVVDETAHPFFYPYVIRRNDPNAALILQRNLEALVLVL